MRSNHFCAVLALLSAFRFCSAATDSSASMPAGNPGPAAPKDMEFGEAVDETVANLSFPEPREEGSFVVTLKNLNPKKNKPLLFADLPCGWSYEMESTGDPTKKYSDRFSSRVAPNAKAFSLPPLQSKSITIGNQTGALYDIPAGSYRIRLSHSMPSAEGSTQPRSLYTNWKEFKVLPEGEGCDAVHREFPHISSSIGAKLSIPEKPASALAFELALRNFGATPAFLYLQSCTGIKVVFTPVGNEKIKYSALADFEKTDNVPNALKARQSRVFQSDIRASLEAARIEPLGTRVFKLDLTSPYTAGPLKGIWTLTKQEEHKHSEPVTALPPGKYRVRAFLDPAPVLDTIVSFIILGNEIWRGLAVSNAIDFEIPAR